MFKMHCMIIACLLAVAAQRVSSSELVPFTKVAFATARRAVCLDGSPGGYHHSAGSGDGARNWLVYLMGGGWCADIATCQSYFNETRGSSRFSRFENFTGILSPDKHINPDFYNWNRIYVVYCDQSSFLGDSEVNGPEHKVQFRGSKIFDAVVEDLLVKGMVILSGRSAGALATILHCDGFRARLPIACRVKCLSDAGFFIRAENVPYADYREQFFASTITLHKISRFLPATCTKRMDPNLCLFPENIVGDVRTPLFILNSAFDYFQVKNRLVPDSSPDWERWEMCSNNLSFCTSSDKQLITDFGDAFFKGVRRILKNPSGGMFIDACYIHSVAYDERYWSPNSTVKLGNLTILEAFANWYFDRDSVTLVTSSKFLEICT
ncbi:pectin acetylesterase 7-like isoform X2 [Salvia splendens]|uniref:pectin acetylesterase 7-like isoform X2 n=1 Tax=Salvia splendens TaxID=180675 RepID=UPI001C27D4D7|nr:pectin acetylesterase 7-like isoform X2 [Salvia splendens]